MDYTPEERINLGRKWIHVHSTIYYHLNDNVVSDAEFDKMAMKLVELHSRYPELVTQGYQWEAFQDWSGDTGMHLPVNDEILNLAEWVLSKFGEL